MSGDWKYYPCQMGEHTAFIFFDFGIRDAINDTAPPQLLQVRLAFRIPRADGLPTNDEFRQLTALEDELQALAQRCDSMYVGRVTVDGHRYFHIFTHDSEEQWSSRLDALGTKHDYPLRFLLKPDENHEGYWKDLYPSEDDWQVIQDLDVLELLAKHGDNGATSRRIDHLAYFPSQAAADQFCQWTAGKGYRLDSKELDDDGQYCVQFSHEGTVLLANITSHTIALRRRASELGGDYDGWGTTACQTK